ncbi:hypothetical protein B9J07_27870 [Sinorhizobium sp. LM21]|nr:hypothetical protein pLM21S1_p69 [Sinorhizobium sp. LM21]OWZ90407.1 hypothetical protein B9J07_27870 [Sinorhizobium sp. LM21]
MTFQSLYDRIKRGWEPGELSIVSARNAGKSFFQEFMMLQPMTSAAPSYHGTTANTIVPDEIGVNEITLDKLRRMVSFDYEATLDSIWLNDLPSRKPMPLMKEVGDKWIFLSDIKASFEDEAFPNANAYLVLEKLDKRDPRHPNPAAGTQKQWFVLQGHKRIQVKNRTQGEAQARSMHLREITAIKKRRDQAELEAAIAIEEARQVAAANEAKLKALPSFGGF